MCHLYSKAVLGPVLHLRDAVRIVMKLEIHSRCVGDVSPLIVQRVQPPDQVGDLGIMRRVLHIASLIPRVLTRGEDRRYSCLHILERVVDKFIH
jgi:hypothetical protein